MSENPTGVLYSLDVCIQQVKILQLQIAVVAHNRFHFKCCDNPPPRKPTVEEVKAKSIMNSVNAQNRRRDRSRDPLRVTRSNPPEAVDAGLPVATLDSPKQNS